MPNTSLKIYVVAVLLSTVLFGIPSVSNAQCGPGDHWVDTCKPGVGGATDSLPTTKATVGIDFDFDGNADMIVTLLGPATIYRADSKDVISGHSMLPNVGTVDSHDDVIETEIISMNLTGSGFTLRAGDGTGNNSDDGGSPRSLYSPGAIDELPSVINPPPPNSDSTVNPALAHSFFYVFFELDGTPWGTLHNNNPAVLEQIIDRVPPLYATYVHDFSITNPIGLYDETDTLRAQLVYAEHDTLVKLMYFTATRHKGNVLVEWGTATETDCAGFNLWRSETEDAGYAKLTESLIPCKGDGSQYKYVDKEVRKKKTYYYKLEDIDLYGVSTFHGPVSVTGR